MKILKKTLGVCLIGLGVGILLVLFLPTLGWLFLIGVVVILVGHIMVVLLKGGLHMTIVVKKVPKCLRGIVKLLFGIKD